MKAMRYHSTRMAMILKTRKKITVEEDMEKLEPLYTAGGDAKWYNPCGKQFGFSDMT
jgi:hypothetical protein